MMIVRTAIYMYMNEHSIVTVVPRSFIRIYKVVNVIKYKYYRNTLH